MKICVVLATLDSTLLRTSTRGRLALEVAGDRLRVPGDVLGLLAQEVVLAALAPQLVELVAA
jgi:hypothetical protein